MKKLLCVGLVASAFAAVAGSEEIRGAQVYDLSISVKTTVAKSGNVSPASNKLVSDSETIVYRKQSTRKWKGLVWGCDCNALAGAWRVVDDSAGSVSGCVIWDGTKPNDVLFIDDIDWKLLNAIDKTGDKCEGSFTIGNMNGDSEAFLAFSGFGTLTLKALSAQDEDPEVLCTSYLKQMSGNVAGWMPTPSITSGGSKGSCTFCGGYDPGEEPTTDMATAWDFCPCEEFADVEHTAVTGTWTLKYNSKASKKLKDSSSIVDAVCLPENVKAQVVQKTLEIL